MKTKYFIMILLIICSHSGYCENIQIKTIDPMPGFEKVGGPAFGESVKSYSGQGLVQYVSDLKIIINSKMFFIDKSCEDQISSSQIRKASIVKYELNKQARIKNIERVVQLNATGKIDRINSDELVIDDQYYLFDLFVTYHEITGDKIDRFDFKKGDFVGVTLNEERKVRTLWHLNGHYLY
jgi:hypothetical protein